MNREEKYERVNKVIESIDNGLCKEEACKNENLAVSTFDKELLIRLALKEYLNENVTISFVSNKYGINRKSIERRLKDMNLKAKKIKNCDETVFDNIDTEEKAYWLGFMYADGYVCTNSFVIGFGLKLEDKDTVIKFTDFMKFKGGCVIKESNKFNSKEKQGYMCETIITNEYLWNSLVKKGVVPHKSLILEFPKIEWFKSKDLIFHFIRGYCDGDGTLGVYPHNKKFPNKNLSETLAFVGTKVFLEGIQEFLGKGSLIQKPNCNENTYVLRYSGNSALSAAALLYNNASIYLPRKKKIYDEKFVPRNRVKTVKAEMLIPC